MSNLRNAAPVFLGVFLGIFLMVSHLTLLGAILVLAAIALIGIGGRIAARRRLRKTPERAVMLWQMSILYPFAIIAASTAATTWIALEAGTWLGKLPDFIVQKNEIAAHNDDLKSVLVGAMNALVAALWLDDAKKPASTFWPAGQIKSALGDTFRPIVSEMKTAGYPHALLQDAAVMEVGGPSITGWSYAMGRERAKVIAQEVAKWEAHTAR